MSAAVLDHSMMQLSAPSAPPRFEPTGQAALTDYLDTSSPSHSPTSFVSSTSSSSSFTSSSCPAVAASLPTVSLENVIDLTAEADDVGEEEKEEWKQRKRRKRMILIEETDEDEDDEEEEEEDEDDDEDDDEEEEDEDEEDEEDNDKEEMPVERQAEAKSNTDNASLQQSLHPSDNSLPRRTAATQRRLLHSADEQFGQHSMQSSSDVERLLQELEEIQESMEEFRDTTAQTGSGNPAPLAALHREPQPAYALPSDARPSTVAVHASSAESTDSLSSFSSSSSSFSNSSLSYSSSSSSPSPSSSSSVAVPSSAESDRLFATAHPHQMQCLLNMGYHKSQAAAALRLAEGDVCAALRWLPPAVPLSPFVVPSSSSPAASAAVAPAPASSVVPPTAPVSSSLSAAQFNRLRSASSHSAVSMPAAAVPTMPSAASPPSSAPRFMLQSPPPPPSELHSQPAGVAVSPAPVVQSVPYYMHTDLQRQQRSRYNLPLMGYDVPRPSTPPISPFAVGYRHSSPSLPQPLSAQGLAAPYPPGAIPIAAPQPRPAQLPVSSRRGRFAAPPASPSPSSSQSHSSSSAFFPYVGSEMDDMAGEVELRQHLMDTLMSYGMAAAHSSAASPSSASSSHSQHRRSRHSHSHSHHPYSQLPMPNAASSSLAAQVLPLDPFDPTGLYAANDTSSLPKTLTPALTALLSYVHTLAPSLAPTQHARLQSITYHLLSLASSSASASVSTSATTTAGSSSSVVTKGETPGEGEGESVCPVCWDSVCDALLLPCRHLSCCERCAGDMKERQLQCPRCNERIRHVLVVRR